MRSPANRSVRRPFPRSRPPRPSRTWLATILLLVAAGLLRSLAGTDSAAEDFRPGQVWRDTTGRPINAHGGGVLFHDGTYYWYGEHKEGRTWLPESNRAWDGYRVELKGVHAYSSRDLLRWKDEGIVLTARPGDLGHDLHPTKVCERPKVIRHPRTGKFVMWMHIDGEAYDLAKAGVATADQPAGPFTYLGSVRPEGQDSRDQTLFQDDDGTAYRVYSSENNDTTYISRLTDDYLAHSGRFERVFVGRRMEAPALCKTGGKYYLIASGCTGWNPNPARSAVADSIWGPWRELGNPCRGEGGPTTFGAQSTFILPVAGVPGAFIFMADRWNKTDLPRSRHVWLPLRFEEGRPVVRWLNQWNLSTFTAARAVAAPTTNRKPSRAP